jgi:hypothetical protein
MSVNPENGDEAVDDVEEQPAETPEVEAQPEGEGETDDAPAETVASFGEPKPEAEKESSVFREVRAKLREQERKARALEAELAQLKAPPKKALGPKPKQDDDGIDYDADKYADALERWLKQKAQAEAGEQEERQAQTRQAEERSKKLIRYREGQGSFKEPAFKEAESVVTSILDVYQQEILLDADNPAALVIALGNDEGKLAELASVKDYAKFAMRVGKLETTLTVTTAKKSPPKPARTINGTAATSGTTRERLLKDAEKSDDVTALVNSIRSKKEK